jgi:hypothetical protein
MWQIAFWLNVRVPMLESIAGTVPTAAYKDDDKYASTAAWPVLGETSCESHFDTLETSSLLSVE